MKTLNTCKFGGLSPVTGWLFLGCWGGFILTGSLYAQGSPPDNGLTPEDWAEIRALLQETPPVAPTGEAATLVGPPTPATLRPAPAEAPVAPTAPEPPASAPDYLETQREFMLGAVSAAWRMPESPNGERQDGIPGTARLLETQMVDRVSFSGQPLPQVLQQLSEISESMDPGGGANLVLIDPENRHPAVYLTLKQLSLARILDLVTESVGYELEYLPDAVIIRPGPGGPRLVTQVFPLSRAALVRLTGAETAPSSPPPAFGQEASAVAATPPGRAIEASLQGFLQRAGIDFAAGASLAYADGQMVVTQTRRNLERIGHILQRYGEVRQVEIEARFLEVQQGQLEEMGVNWRVAVGGDPAFDPSGNPILRPDGSQDLVNQDVYQSANRSLAQPFLVQPDNGSVTISGQRNETTNGQTRTVPFMDRVGEVGPAFPAALDLGNDAGAIASVRGVIGDAELGVLVRALERQTGSDLLSAPKVTVLSGRTAEIVVARELRYPVNYGDMEAQVGRGSSDSGSAGVAIITGTPRDFATRNIGVEMAVTPNVEGDSAISLVLQPQVTEFEGFIEYGGRSVAIASSNTVTVPSGFYQPIFNVRRVHTEVTIDNGATVVMGGLTREQRVSIEDRVPLLGDLPLLGRLFRSEGESSQKRNLLIFVTARLIDEHASLSLLTPPVTEP